MFGLFAENGPYRVDTNLKLVPQPYTWNSKYHMLYIDNPVGAGFSFTDCKYISLLTCCLL